MKKSRREFIATQGPGTVIRGVDGHLYWIPDTKLASFKIPDSARDKVQDMLDHLDAEIVVANLKTKFSKNIGLSRGTEEIETLVNLGAIRKK